MDEASIFLEALQKPTPEERAAFLEQACGDNRQMRHSVELLLRAHAKAGGFLADAPAPLPVTVDQPASESPGTVIGPYKLLQQIGEGGMGTVYMAEQTEPVKRKVALKVIKAGMDSRQVVARFEAERQALALMDHVNIARVFDGGATENGRPYFVMELVHGVPITKYCDDNHLTPRQRLELFIPVCRAIQHAHQKGVIHRDIKPSNVMVTLYDGKPVPKVIDFGVAKATEQKLTERTLFTQYGTMVGTLEYMSPEQAEMSALGVDTRSDIYSLGVLLYELLTGTTPLTHKRFKAATFAEILRVIKEEEPQKPSARLSDLGETLASISANRHMEPARLTRLVRGELDWVAMKTLEKDRTRRYETASGLAADVERYLNDEPVQACPPSAVYRLRKFARRNRRALATASVVGVALLFAVGSLGWVVRDRAASRVRTAGEVDQFLRRAESYYADNKLPEALAEAEKARGLLEAGSGDEELRRRVQQWRDDLNMAMALEEVRLEAVGGESHAQVNALLAHAFREYGLDVETLPTEEVTARIAASRIRFDLATALRNWARGLRRDPHSRDATSWQRLLAIAQAANPDPWWQRLETAADARDLQTLREIADGTDLARTRTSALAYVGGSLRIAGDVDAAVAFLRRAQQQHPGDFLISICLAQSLRDLKPPPLDEVLAFHRVALALRPRSAWAHYSLAGVLGEKGRLDEAVAEYREAIKLRPGYPSAYNNLGLALQDQEKLDDAIACFRKAIQANPKLVSGHNNLGLALTAQGELNGAVASYREAIALDPRYGMAHNNLGRALMEQKKLDEAAASYREAIALEPDSALPHHNLGLALRKQGNHAEGVACHRQAIALDPKLIAPRISLAVALASENKLDEAVACCREAVAIDPKVAEAHFALGNVLDQQNKLDEAVACFREAIALDPKFVSGHNNLGHALQRQNKLDEAVACFREAIRLRPDHSSAHFNLGRALLRQNKLDEAVAAYREAVRLDPDWEVARTGLGFVLEAQGKTDAAIAEYREAIRLKPGYDLAHHNLGVALMHQGRVDDAIAAYREAIRLAPGEFKYPLNLGIALLGKKDWDGAVAALREAARLKPGSPDAHYQLGNALFEKQAWADAVTAYEEAIRLRPDWAHAQHLRGIALKKAGRPDEAIAAFREAIRLQPNYDRPYYHLGSTLVAKGDPDAAVEVYRKALVLNPKSADARAPLGLLLNNSAWHLATHVDPKRRDPARAVELAKEATGLVPGAHWNTLGAAHYRVGAWKAAITALEQSMKVREGGDSFDWFFLAMAHWRLGDKVAARRWYDLAVTWMDKNQPTNEELRRFRAEAAEVLGVAIEVAPPPRQKK